MKCGWGYNANRKNQDTIFVDSIAKDFENENFKVYKNTVKLCRGGNYNITILFNKQNKSIKLVVSGTDCGCDKIETISKDVTKLKYIKSIKKYITENIIQLL